MVRDGRSSCCLWLMERTFFCGEKGGKALAGLQLEGWLPAGKAPTSCRCHWHGNCPLDLLRSWNHCVRWREEHWPQSETRTPTMSSEGLSGCPSPTPQAPPTAQSSLLPWGQLYPRSGHWAPLVSPRPQFPKNGALPSHRTLGDFLRAFLSVLRPGLALLGLHLKAQPATSSWASLPLTS